MHEIVRQLAITDLVVTGGEEQGDAAASLTAVLGDEMRDARDGVARGAVGRVLQEGAHVR